ncbi:conserved hypothetical protein [Paenibacillus curdlanolyticus YK9]|uniref:Uncharacterized protein n=1 Tax=Paenibacillus curdlanolyticus YK9 TaxID=717606 RepID=E0I472_9BACL|nr:hypothetical protein [Paenibacillus curdlanolyticus]EFM13086.1 conserved hypothetical protein [Paenibacillus curdlanolyticus YK9]
MSYRSIDLQLSVSRMPDHGVAHSQALQKPVMDQTHLEGAAMKQADLARTRNEGVEEPSKSSIRDGGGNNSSNQQGRKKRETQGEHEDDRSRSDNHPYKGKHIDFSL